MDLDHVAGRPRKGRNDRRLAPRQPVEQGRLSGVGRPGDGDDNPVAQPFAAPAVGERCRDLLAQSRDRRQRRTHEILRHIAFVGKVDPRLDQGERFDQGPAPGFGAVADQALELAERLPPLRRRLRRDQVGKAFHGGQIEPAVLETRGA